MLDKGVTDTLLGLLVDTSSSDRLRSSVIETMSSFAKEEECVMKLVEKKVVEKLLSMLQGKVLTLVVVELFSRLNEYNSFQKKIFEINGLSNIVSMLESSLEVERVAGLKAMAPFANNPNGKIVLLQLGVIRLLKKMFDDSSLVVQTLAKSTYKKIYKDGDATFKLELDPEKPFSFDYDEISRIDKELVLVCQENIVKRLDKKKVKLQVNWRQILKLPLAKRADAMILLSREEIWDDIVTGIDLFAKDDELRHTFASNVKYIFVDIVEGEASMDVQDLEMTLRLPLDATNIWTPKAIASNISKQLLGGKDITEEIEEMDEKYQLAVEDLKKVCKNNKIATLGDVNILYLHLVCADKLWKQPFSSEQVIAVAKKEILDPKELFLKAWNAVKFNRKGMHQDRLLILTNVNMYTVAIDPKSKKIDYSHCKIHPLDAVDSVDVGCLIEEGKKVDDTPINQRVYAICIYCMDDDGPQQEQQSSGKGSSKVADLDEEKPSKQNAKEQQKASSSNVNKKEDKGKVEEVAVDEQAIANNAGIGGADDDDKPGGGGEARDTEGLKKYIFLPHESVPKSKRRLFCDEIGWCTWAAACAFNRKLLQEPQNAAIEKPKAGMMSKFYNALGLGNQGG